MNAKRVTLGIMSLLILVSCGRKGQEEKEDVALPYQTMVLQKQDAVLENSYPATVKGQEDIEIRPRVDGFIDAIYVDEGSVVRKGQALFKINSPMSEQNLRTAEASLNSAEAQLNTAEVNVSRIRPLAEKGIVSNTQLQTYENAYKASQATVAQAQAALTNARATMGWTTVTSPVDGIVGTIPYRQGSLVNNANVLTTVANISNVYVYFSINEKELMTLLGDLPGKTQAEKIKGMPDVWLKLANGSRYPHTGKVSTIAGQVNVSTGSVNFRANFPNPEGILRSGFSGRVVIPQEVENTIVIPQAATFQQQNKMLTYKVQGDSVVSTLISVLPMPDGKHYVVTDGLNENDRIVTEGIATLAPGKKIIVK